MSEVQEMFEGTKSDEAIKAAREARLTPKGRYRANVKAFNGGRETKEYFDAAETQKNPFYGRIRWNLQLTLTSKRAGEDVKLNKTAPWESLENPLTFFLKLSPATVVVDGRLQTESKLYGDIAETWGKEVFGHAPTDEELYNWFKDEANVFEIYIDEYEGGTNKKTGKEFAAGNRVNSVRPIKEVA